MNNITQTNSRLLDLGGITSSQTRSSHIVRLLAWVLIPGYYPILTDNTLIGTGLMLATTLWVYNLIICNTTIMDPFPPSTTWFNGVLPLLIWSVNFALLLILPNWRHKFLRGNP
jgi:hypothetical protein